MWLKSDQFPESMKFYLQKQKSINHQELISNRTKSTLGGAVYCADIVSSCNMIEIFYRNFCQRLCGLATTKGCIIFLLRTKSHELEWAWTLDVK